MHMCLRPVGTTYDAEVERIVGLGASIVDDRRAETAKAPLSRGLRAGAASENRTPDLFITSESLCRLS